MPLPTRSPLLMATALVFLNSLPASAQTSSDGLSYSPSALSWGLDSLQGIAGRLTPRATSDRTAPRLVTRSTRTTDPAWEHGALGYSAGLGGDWSLLGNLGLLPGPGAETALGADPTAPSAAPSNPAGPRPTLSATPRRDEGWPPNPYLRLLAILRF